MDKILLSWLVVLSIVGTILCNWHIIFTNFNMVIDIFIKQRLADYLWNCHFATNSLWVLLYLCTFHHFSHCLALRGRTQGPPPPHSFMSAAMVAVSHLLLLHDSFHGTIPFADHWVLPFPSLLIQVPPSLLKNLNSKLYSTSLVLSANLKQLVYMYLSQLMSTFTNYLKVHCSLNGYFHPVTQKNQ